MLATRVQQEVFELANRIADQEKISQSELLRNLIITEGRTRGLWPLAASRSERGTHERQPA